MQHETPQKQQVHAGFTSPEAPFTPFHQGATSTVSAISPQKQSTGLPLFSSRTQPCCCRPARADMHAAWTSHLQQVSCPHARPECCPHPSPEISNALLHATHHALCLAAAMQPQQRAHPEWNNGASGKQHKWVMALQAGTAGQPLPRPQASRKLTPIGPSAACQDSSPTTPCCFNTPLQEHTDAPQGGNAAAGQGRMKGKRITSAKSRQAGCLHEQGKPHIQSHCCRPGPHEVEAHHACQEQGSRLSAGHSGGMSGAWQHP